MALRQRQELAHLALISGCRFCPLLGINVPDIIRLPGAPAAKLDAVLATRRAKAAAAEAA